MNGIYETADNLPERTWDYVEAWDENPQTENQQPTINNQNNQEQPLYSVRR